MKDLLSPKELAEAIGVSQSSIKRWTDEGLIQAARTAGGHRRITISEAIRFVRESGSTLVRPQVLGLPGSSRVGRSVCDLKVATEELESHLKEGKAAASRGLIISLYLSGLEVAEIADGPVRETLAKLGELFLHETDEGIFIEHRATQICLQAFHALRSVIQEPMDGPLAIGGAVSDDPYQLPTQIAATALAAAGYRTINLGPETPVSALERAARQQEPRLLWMSVSVAARPEKLTEELNALLDRLDGEGIGLALGGRDVGRLALRPRPGLFIGRSMAELIAYARGLGAVPRQLPS